MHPQKNQTQKSETGSIRKFRTLNSEILKTTKYVFYVINYYFVNVLLLSVFFIKKSPFKKAQRAIFYKKIQEKNIMLTIK